MGGAFPPRPIWGVSELPDLTAKVIFVTGALSRYIVKACVLNLVDGNAGAGRGTVKVCWLVGRDPLSVC